MAVVAWFQMSGLAAYFPSKARGVFRIFLGFCALTLVWAIAYGSVTMCKYECDEVSKSFDEPEKYDVNKCYQQCEIKD